IGKLFRDQFADAMQRNGNNLDTTINNWAGEVAKTKSTVDASQKPAQ
ncbi:toluene tolerance protein, partial [Pseudomonas coronafaciens]